MDVYRVSLFLSHILAHQYQGVASIATKGSTNKELQDIAFAMFEIRMSKSIHLKIEWIPRSDNEKTDCIFRIIDHDDWDRSFEHFEIRS